MKIISFVLLLLFVSCACAATIDEADYPIQYEVMNTSKVGAVMIGNFCTMSLRDQSKPTVVFVVMRKGYGACHVWDSGTVFHGRREKNKIQILTHDDKGKLKVEDWPITGTVAVNSK